MKNAKTGFCWRRVIVITAIFALFTSFAIADVQAGTAGYWSFEDGSGSIAEDSSSNGNDGSLTNMDTSSCWVTGKRGLALDFDGTNDYVSISSPSGLTSETGSIEFWMKADSVQNGTLFHFYESAGTDYIRSHLNTYGRLDLIVEDGNVVKVNVYYDLDDLASGYVGKWLYIAWVQDGTEVKLYINGERKPLSGTNSGDWWSDHLSLSSARIGYGWNYFNGMIDEFMVCDHAPGTSDILDRINGKYADGGWHFNDGSGSTATDFTGNGNDASLVDMNTASCWVDGISSYALDFDGSDDKVSVSSPSGLTSETGTIEFWMKADDVQDGSLFHFYESAGTDYIRSHLNSYERLDLVIEDGNDIKVNVYYDLTELPDDYVNEWLYVVWTQDGYGVKLYINGERKQLSGTNSGDWWSNHLSLSECKIGRGWGTFDGIIDEFSVMNQPVDEAYIASTWANRGLRGCWEMNEDDGTTVYDSSGFDNHASFVNMAASPWTSGLLDSSGYFQRSLYFNESGDYLSVANDSSLQITGDLTISMWVKPVTIGVKQCSLLDKDFGGEFSVVMDSDGAVHLIQGKSQTSGDYFDATVISAGNIVNSQRQHIAITRNMDTREIKGYLDGVLQNTVTYPDDSDYSPPAETTSAVQIGSGDFSDFNGNIDKVKIYSRALSEEEISGMNFLTVYPDRNYYTTESPVIICKLDIPEADGLTSCVMTVKDSLGNTLGNNSSPGITTEVTCNISSLSAGEHTLTVEFSRSGDIIYFRNVDIVKRASSSGVEVKADRKNGTLLVDNDAFFPIGLYLFNVDSGDTADFQDASSAGFNTVIRWQLEVTPSDATTYLETADTYDLYVIDWLSAYSNENFNDYKYGSSTTFWDVYIDERENILDAVGLAKIEDNLLAYYTFDEPTDAVDPAGQDLYDETNDEDGYHPTLCFGHPEGTDYYRWCDVLGVGMYWIPPEDDDDIINQINRVTKEVCRAKKLADSVHKPLFFTIMGEFYGSSIKRAITTAEQRCQTYLALIHGAKGIFYFRYPIYHDDSWSTLTDLTGELEDLAPSMLTPDLEQTVTYSSSPFVPEMEEFPDVQVCLRKAPSGASYDYVLLAANTLEYSVDVDYAISLLGSSGTVSRLFDTGTYTVTDGEFSDTLAAHATRAYTFTSTSTDPITIDVDTTPGTPPTPETAYPTSGRSGCTNIFQNPSLEDNTITKWPDYCYPYYASPRINATNQGWGLETTSPYHGSNCLKIVNTGNFNGFYFPLVPYHTETSSQDYTFSVYLKADQSGREVWLGYNSGYTTVTPTTSWQRYSFTVSIPPRWGESKNKFYVRLIDEGTLWVDAVQVEQASSATAFTTD